MNDFIEHRCARAGSVRVSHFIRALKASGVRMRRTDVVAALSRQFEIANVNKQAWIVGLSLRDNENRLRQFIDQHCIRADGLTTKLSAIVRAVGMTRTEVISQLESCGFNIITASGPAMVRGLGLKEVYV